ncbi:hypothetical protein [Couchioplanes caeruleus]|uniref:Uncharacterized protein n=2 Tax=Couchioplanes caeruleus TaxID=56438 RepID=A0A1K0GYI1_9ACTN|nr:hypothetical protein [Couchioplanes caeruleus]OJF14491.1 hypothetical protein BG844_09640 [Couchioplanes caeruleus subsp. caeruleus]ROP21276.1 hypothetical protein EDD30_7672 [Couchioplanes caeruleus]
MSFREELRHQFAAESESDAVGRIRFYAAGLNILGGIFAFALIFMMVGGRLSWAAAPGCALLIAGAVWGVMVQLTRDVFAGRQRLWWAWGCTVLGVLEIVVVANLAS